MNPEEHDEELEPQAQVLPPAPPVPASEGELAASNDPDEEDEESSLEEKAKALIAPRKGRTMKDAKRALTKFGNKHGLKAGQWAGAADFGEFLIGKGPRNIGVALQVYAANKMKEGIERCDQLIDQVGDPELQVRLEENKKGYCEAVGKIGAALCKDEPVEAQTLKQPGPQMPIFPANQVVSVMIQNNEKP